MLNSNYLSKRAFTLTLKVFPLWLKQQYNISIYDDNDVFTKQVHFYHSYIKFLNYRERYIQEYKKTTKTEFENQLKILHKLDRELLSNHSIYLFSKTNL